MRLANGRHAGNSRRLRDLIVCDAHLLRTASRCHPSHAGRQAGQKINLTLDDLEAVRHVPGVETVVGRSQRFVVRIGPSNDVLSLRGTLTLQELGQTLQ